MRMLSTRLVVALIISLVVSVAAQGASTIQIKLKRGITFEIPRNWAILSSGTRESVNKFIQDMNDADSHIVFQANLKSDDGSVLTNVQVYFWESQFGQGDIKQYSEQDLAAYNQELRDQTVSQLEKVGGELLEWHGSNLAVNGDQLLLRSDYTRAGADNPFMDKRVRIYRYYGKDESFSFVINYFVWQKDKLKPIVDQIVHSLEKD